MLTQPTPKYLLTCLDSHMNFSDLSFLTPKVQHGVGPPFAAIKTKKSMFEVTLMLEEVR